jgi:histidinol dehydrogenase
VIHQINAEQSAPFLHQFIARRHAQDETVERTVKSILAEVKEHGDKAVRKFTAEFDQVDLKSFRVSERELNAAINSDFRAGRHKHLSVSRAGVRPKFFL